MTNEEFQNLLSQATQFDTEPARIRELSNPSSIPYTDYQVPTSNVAPPSFASNLGGLLFGGADSGLSEYLTRDQQKQMQSQALMNAAMSLLKNSGWTTQPISLGQALGSAYEAGTAGYQTAQENAIKQLLTKQKLDEYKKTQATQDILQKIMTGETPIVGAETTQAATKVTPEDIQYDRYMRAAQLFAAIDPAKAKAYQELAKTIKPTIKTVGEPYRTAEGKTYQRTETGGRIEIPSAEAPAVEPIGEMKEVTDASGKPILVQRYKDGSIKTVEGFGVPRELVQVNLGGSIMFVDKNKIPANATYLTGLTPAEEARLKIEQKNLDIALQRLNLSKAEFQRGQYDRVETADGFAYVPKVPGMPIIPIIGASGEQLTGKGAATEDQSKAAGFALRMSQATQLMNGPVIDPNTNKPLIVNGKQVTLEEAFGTPSRTQSILRAIPSAGITTGIANFFEGAGRQQYRQAQENWVTANLRAESGAAIGVDEMEKEIQKYFPQANDKPQTIAQKAEARKAAELAMQVRGGPAFKTIKKSQQQPVTGGGLTWNPVTQQFE